jgi:hypothetical protein
MTEAQKSQMLKTLKFKFWSALLFGMVFVLSMIVTKSHATLAQQIASPDKSAMQNLVSQAKEDHLQMAKRNYLPHELPGLITGGEWVPETVSAHSYELSGEWERLTDKSRIRYKRNVAYMGKSYNGFLTRLGSLATYGFKLNEHTLTLTLDGDIYKGKAKWKCTNGNIKWKEDSITFLDADRFQRNSTLDVYVRVKPTTTAQEEDPALEVDLTGEWERAADKTRIRYERHTSRNTDSYVGFLTQLGSLAPYGFKKDEYTLTLTREGNTYRGKFKWRYRDGRAEWIEGSITILDKNSIRRNDTNEIYSRVH